ncbi:MAG: hypothetical protein A2Y25_04140 [Candidatus Melainabacteria bacterium GWF2_37_15]|nr:MAG: hypothetical protein A2Y25_04140 [Candidatus Melainabacteria bacterium GWF2_37_15]
MIGLNRLQPMQSRVIADRRNQPIINQRFPSRVNQTPTRQNDNNSASVMSLINQIMALLKVLGIDKGNINGNNNTDELNTENLSKLYDSNKDNSISLDELNQDTKSDLSSSFDINQDDTVDQTEYNVFKKNSDEQIDLSTFDDTLKDLDLVDEQEDGNYDKGIQAKYKTYQAVDLTLDYAENNLSAAEYEEYKSAIEDLDDFTNVNPSSKSNAQYISKDNVIYMNADSLEKDLPLEFVASNILHETTHKIQKDANPADKGNAIYEGQAYSYQINMLNDLGIGSDIFTEGTQQEKWQALMDNAESHKDAPDDVAMTSMAETVQEVFASLYGKIPFGDVTKLPDLNKDGTPG